MHTTAPQKPRVSISFSGGRTSAVMTELVIKELGPTHEINVLFANTGQEHPATLDFIRDCDTRLGFNTVWLEAVVNPEAGKGVRHRVVTHETASLDGRPFRDYIAKVRSWGFDLTIPEHLGNCTWCWKKSYRKLLTVAKNNPGFLEFPAQMEEEFGMFKVTPATGSPDGRRLFFRGHRSTSDLIEEAKQSFVEFTDKHHIPYDERFDFGVGCGESCEVGSDERYGVEVPDEEFVDEDPLEGI